MSAAAASNATIARFLSISKSALGKILSLAINALSFTSKSNEYWISKNLPFQTKTQMTRMQQTKELNCEKSLSYASQNSNEKLCTVYAPKMCQFLFIAFGWMNFRERYGFFFVQWANDDRSRLNARWNALQMLTKKTDCSHEKHTHWWCRLTVSFNTAKHWSFLLFSNTFLLSRRHRTHNACDEYRTHEHNHNVGTTIQFWQLPPKENYSSEENSQSCDYHRIVQEVYENAVDPGASSTTHWPMVQKSVA